jgi:hypothetical protein
MNIAGTGTTANPYIVSASETDPRVPTGTAIGQMQYWNGTAWVVVATTPNEGATLQMIGGVPKWVGGTPPPTVPDAPIIGTVTAGNTQAFVSFTAPASNGGSSIISYTATSNPGNITKTIVQAGSGTIIVTGLTNGTPYTFTVTATNSVGKSTPSAASNSVNPFPTVPDAPVIGTATAGILHASVPFTAPANNGGSSIIACVATSNPGNITSSILQAGSGTIIVNGLTAGTAYTFTVTAINSKGTSIPSATSNSVTIVGISAGEVYNPTTGKIWMDRNLGASQVATSSADVASYGDLYQWGRGTDGHQLRTSATTTTLSSVDQPAHGNFITVNSGDFDWRSPQNDNLWQGVNGVNNPCPSGYRLPTSAELDAERFSWIQLNSAGAFASPLKLPMAGSRFYNNGSLNVVSTGYYWSSTVSGISSYFLIFDPSSTGTFKNYRANGLSVRCIKN